MEFRDSVKQSIVERISLIFGISPENITEDTKFEADLGAKSGNMSQLINYLEDEFDVEIPYMEFRRHETVGSATDFIVELCEE